MARSPYDGMFERLVANTEEPENDQCCWLWTGKHDRGGYGRVNVYVPGLGRVVTLMAHIALLAAYKTNPLTADEFYLSYLEIVASGLELDHLCETPSCISVDHLEPVTPSENCKRRYARRHRWVFASSVI